MTDPSFPFEYRWFFMSLNSLQTIHGDENYVLRQMKSEDEAPTPVLCFKGIENLHLPFSETLEVNGNVLKKENISEEESTRWHNTACTVVKEVDNII